MVHNYVFWLYMYIKYTNYIIHTSTHNFKYFLKLQSSLVSSHLHLVRKRLGHWGRQLGTYVPRFLDPLTCKISIFSVCSISYLPRFFDPLTWRWARHRSSMYAQLECMHYAPMLHTQCMHQSSQPYSKSTKKSFLIWRGVQISFCRI